MSKRLRVLHLEDNKIDSELVRGLLRKEGLDCEILVVETKEAFQSALEDQQFDLILSDFSLPSYDGRSALSIARQKCPDVPYIFFSGTLGEESAVEALRIGATDYVIKHNRAKLIPAIRRALNEAWERAERKRTEEELRKTEMQLRQSQKLEGIGQLAGGIAHDFNNLLTVINGYSDLILSTLPPDHDIVSQVQQIREAGKRATSLTQQILAFSRQQTLTPIVFTINDAVVKMEAFLRRLIGEHVKLVTAPDPTLGYIKADQGQIEQVIMNLAVNARDAMPDGGTLRIETCNVEVDESFARIHMLPQAGSYVRLSVLDTGCGMDAALQARIFEPFFTTKGPAKGTGLGLATVYGIVQQSSGAISVESELGNGTTFHVYLPRVNEEPATVVKMPAVARVLPSSETILLVEDEEIVRRLVGDILRRKGYTVFDADHGKKAQEICSQSAEPIHLLITDVVMPDINGHDLAERVMALRPGIKVLYLSGYMDKSNQGKFPSSALLLQKPFTPDALIQKIQEILR